MDDGGPAFPVENQALKMSDGSYALRSVGCAGMTLRDYFSGRVVASCLLNSQRHADKAGVKFSYEIIAREAYRIADAMLAERSKTK